MNLLRNIAFLAILPVGVGCADDGIRTHPVRGEVAVAQATAAPLAGSTVELALESDPTVRAAGQIGPDGKFSVESLSAGQLRHGALEGKYKARIVLNDENRARRKQAARSVDPRFLDFETSGLTVHVPPPGEVVLNVAPRNSR